MPLNDVTSPRLEMLAMDDLIFDWLKKLPASQEKFHPDVVEPWQELSFSSQPARNTPGSKSLHARLDRATEKRS